VADLILKGATDLIDAKLLNMHDLLKPADRRDGCLIGSGYLC